MSTYFLSSRGAAGSTAVYVAGDETPLEYSELWSLVGSRAGAWSESGLAAGDRVLFSPRRDIASIVNLHALMWLGAIPVLVSPRQFEQLDACADPTLGLRWRLDGEGELPELPLDAASVVAPVSLPLDAQVAVLFSSGSTGAPKAIPLTRKQILASIEQSASRLELKTTDRWLCVLPLYHIGGLSILLRSARIGGAVVLMSGRFSAERSVDLCVTGQVTQVSLVPVQLERMFSSIEKGMLHKDFRFLLVGGAAMSEQQIQQACALELPVVRTWGMTECASQIATTHLGDVRGLLWPLVETRVERTESGRLAVHGPIAPDGYFLTQDIGEVDEGIRIQSRADNVILSGGEKISLTRLQAVLAGHPDIVDCIVIARENADWGQRPHAVLVARSSRVPTNEALFAYLAEEGFRRREMFDTLSWAEGIPRNEMGKLQWQELQSLL